MPVKKKSGPTLFDFLNQIYLKTEKFPYDKKAASAYMLSLWLSQDKYLIYTVNEINRLLFLLPDDIIYKYYFDKIPKGKRYIKWTKKREEDKKIKKQIESIMEGTNISKREAKMILTLRGECEN